MAAELAFDVVKQILVRLDVKDLLRFKSACKSWYFFISSPGFVKDHLRHACKNDSELGGHRRICSHAVRIEDSWFYDGYYNIVGSCNGLVCISPEDVELVVANPSTREVKKVQTPPFRPQMRKIVNTRHVVSWGFGYDSSVDDYKVIAGFRKSYSDYHQTFFHALTLKSNVWKYIGEVNLSCSAGRSGIFLGGALYWFMLDENSNKVICSLDLSTEEFKEIPFPDAHYLKYEHSLGVLDDSLCIYDASTSLPTRKFVMKNNKWELYDDDDHHHHQSKYDVAHFLTLETYGRGLVWGHDDGKRVPTTGKFIRSSVFVKSLVSPHPHVNNKINYYGEPTRNAKILEKLLVLKDLERFIDSLTKGNMNKKKRKRIEKRKIYYAETLGVIWV